MKLSSLVEQSSDQIKALQKNPFFLYRTDTFYAVDVGLLDFVLEIDQDGPTKICHQ